MDKEVFILTKEQLDGYAKFCIKSTKNHISKDSSWWNRLNPLPSPVKVLKAIEISHDPSEQGMYESGYDACLSDLGLK